MFKYLNNNSHIKETGSCLASNKEKGEFEFNQIRLFLCCRIIYNSTFAPPSDGYYWLGGGNKLISNEIQVYTASIS